MTVSTHCSISHTYIIYQKNCQLLFRFFTTEKDSSDLSLNKYMSISEKILVSRKLWELTEGLMVFMTNTYACLKLTHFKH